MSKYKFFIIIEYKLAKLLKSILKIVIKDRKKINW